jgi:hypothetical protein
VVVNNVHLSQHDVGTLLETVFHLHKSIIGQNLVERLVESVLANQVPTRLLSDRRGFGKASLLLIIVLVASIAFGIGYWGGFLRPTANIPASRAEML